MGFPGGSMVKNLPAMREPQGTQFNPLVGKIPWRRACHLTPAFLPGRSHEQRNLVGYSQWNHKEADMTKHPPAPYPTIPGTHTNKPTLRYVLGTLRSSESRKDSNKMKKRIMEPYSLGLEHFFTN